MSRTASLDNYTSVPLEPVGGDDCYELLWFRNVFTAFAQKPVFLGRLEKGVRTVFAEWALDPDMAEIPGGKTGLIVRDFKGKDAKSQPENKLDKSFVLGYVLVDDWIHSRGKGD